MHTKFWNSLFLVEIVHPLRPWPEKLGPSWWGETQLRSWTPRRLLTTTITSLPLPPLLLAIVLWNLPMSSTISPLLVYSLYLNSHDMFFYFFWWWLFFFIWCVWSYISVCYIGLGRVSLSNLQIDLDGTDRYCSIILYIRCTKISSRRRHPLTMHSK